MNLYIAGGITAALLLSGGGLYLKGRSDGKASVIEKQQRIAAKLKAEQDVGLADVMTNYIFGVQDDAKLTALLESAVDGLRVCPNGSGVPVPQPGAAKVPRPAAISAAVKSDLKAGIACHRQLSALIDAAIVAGAAKP